MAIVARPMVKPRADAGMPEERGTRTPVPVPTPNPAVAEAMVAWRKLLREDMAREMADPRWPRALVGVGVVHLLASLVGQALMEPVPRRDLRYLVIWFVEVLAVFAVMRLLAGRHWIRRNAAVNLAAKFWTTFLILSFSVVSLNSMIGIDPPWFKPVWCTLGTFFFASLAWLFSPLFFIPAVQMWATSLLMATFDYQGYAIHGVSWFLALCGIAARLRGGR